MSPQEKIEFQKMKEQLAEMQRLFVITPSSVRITKTVQVDGLLNADRVYTQRSGSYVELTS